MDPINSKIVEISATRWAFKISKYLSYCVDGGLGIDFYLEKIIKNINNLKKENKGLIVDELMYMLFLQEKSKIY